jgi:hypothetical protein
MSNGSQNDTLSGGQLFSGSSHTGDLSSSSQTRGTSNTSSGGAGNTTACAVVSNVGRAPRGSARGSASLQTQHGEDDEEFLSAGESVRSRVSGRVTGAIGRRFLSEDNKAQPSSSMIPMPSRTGPMGTKVVEMQRRIFNSGKPPSPHLRGREPRVSGSPQHNEVGPRAHSATKRPIVPGGRPLTPKRPALPLPLSAVQEIPQAPDLTAGWYDEDDSFAPIIVDGAALASGNVITSDLLRQCGFSDHGLSQFSELCDGAGSVVGGPSPMNMPHSFAPFHGSVLGSGATDFSMVSDAGGADVVSPDTTLARPETRSTSSRDHLMPPSVNMDRVRQEATDLRLRLQGQSEAVRLSSDRMSGFARAIGEVQTDSNRRLELARQELQEMSWRQSRRSEVLRRISFTAL